MEIRELRIGNLINNEFKKPIRVSFDTLQSIHYRRNMFYTPITLTEEWLIKFGFESKKDYWNHWNFDLSLHRDGDNWESNQLPMYIFLKYVHQLQNLYFALTSIELELSSNVA